MGEIHFNMDDWEKDDYEPPAPAVSAANDRWDGEDEEDVKDNWEDSDDGNKPESEQTPKEGGAYQRKKKKPLAERIAEKQKLKLEADAAAKEAKKELTPEEKLAEKIRLQKIQEEADLKNAKDLFGVDGESSAKGSIDKMYPETKEEFEQFAEALKTKITFFESSKEYGEFMEKLINQVSVTLPVEVIKKIGVSLNQLYHEKERQRKEAVKNKKKKQKAIVRIERDDLGLADGTGGDFYDDDDDFI